MVAQKGSLFCAEHICGKDNALVGDAPDKIRIPCPLDPKHTVFKGLLQRHLLVCNSRKRAPEVYEIRGINLPEQFEDVEENDFEELLKNKIDYLVEKVKQLDEKLGLSTLVFTSSDELINIHPVAEEALCDPNNHWAINPPSMARHWVNRPSTATTNSDQKVKVPFSRLDEPDTTVASGRLAVSLGASDAVSTRMSVQCCKDEARQAAHSGGGLRHVYQNGCLASLLAREGLLCRDVHFIELGAGRGGLSHWLHSALLWQEMNCVDAANASQAAVGAYEQTGEADKGDHNNGEREARLDATEQRLRMRLAPLLPKSAISGEATDVCAAPSDTVFLLVEVQSMRNKMDTRHHVGAKFERLRMDIADLDLNRVPCLKVVNRPLVAIAKHLCGDATDLALRCLRTSVFSNEIEFNSSRSSSCKVPKMDHPVGAKLNGLRGVCMALCCHSRCTWRGAVGREWLAREAGLTAGEFTALARLSSWATSGMPTRTHVARQGEVAADIRTNQGQDDNYVEGQTDFDKDGQEHEEQANSIAHASHLSVEERQKVGLICKRLIDWSRLQYARHVLGIDNARLEAYTTRDFTPENIVLLGTLSSQKC